MTGPRTVHPEFEELISASLTGDLTDQERRRLDAHLDTCDACRGTLAAFADERRIVAGLRHVPIPRDLHARVRTGIERGALIEVPWWRRPAVVFAAVGGSLAAVAGAMLALVVLNQDPGPGPVGNATPTPEPTPAPTATAFETPVPSPMPSEPTAATLPPATVAPSPDASASAAPTPELTPGPTPVPTAPEPDIFLGHTGPFDNRALIATNVEAQETTEMETPPGPPIAAVMSPDGQWLAYIVRAGETGLHEVRATRVAEADPDLTFEGDLAPIDSPIEVGETVVLGESLSDDPFLEQMFWSSPRGVYLAYTIADPDTGGTEVWLFEPETGEHRQQTDTGNAFAASFVPGSDLSTAALWVSAAGERPVSYLLSFHVSAGGDGAPSDPAETAIAMAEGVFQPLLNVDGRFAIYWDGAMARGGDDATGPWRFTAGAQPYMSYHVVDGEDIGFDPDSERPLFRDLAISREAFTSASITWGPDGDTYAIWDVRWTGVPQTAADGSDYPDPRRVYFSRATDQRGMTSGQAIDAGDLPEEWSVVDVKISPTAGHLAITVARPLAGVLDPPEADLLLVDRNFGDEEDEVTVLAGEDDEFWWGPAAFDQR